MIFVLPIKLSKFWLFQKDKQVFLENFRGWICQIRTWEAVNSQQQMETRKFLPGFFSSLSWWGIWPISLCFFQFFQFFVSLISFLVRETTDFFMLFSNKKLSCREIFAHSFFHPLTAGNCGLFKSISTDIYICKMSVKIGVFPDKECLQILNCSIWVSSWNNNCCLRK